MQRPEQASLATPRPRPRADAEPRTANALRRRGIASLLAMLYLIIFSALALGFYAAVTMATQLAHNDEKAMNAQVAAESGLKFVRYQLSRVRVPGNTPPNEMMQEVLKDLLAQQGASDNLAGRGIGLGGQHDLLPRRHRRVHRARRARRRLPRRDHRRRRAAGSASRFRPLPRRADLPRDRDVFRERHQLHERSSTTASSPAARSSSRAARP